MKFSKVRRQKIYTSEVGQYAIEKIDNVWKAYKGTRGIGEWRTLRGAKLCCEADKAAESDPGKAMAIHIAAICQG